MTAELGGRAKITLQPAPDGGAEAKLRYQRELLIADGADATEAVGALHEQMRAIDDGREGGA